MELDAALYAAESRSRSSNEIREYLKRLAEDRGAEAAGFLAQLAETSDPKLSLPAVEALGRIRDRAAADALALLVDKTESRETRKRAKAMLFQLRSWGIEPSRAEGKAPPREEQEVRPEFLDGRVSFLDHNGHRIVWALTRDAAGLSHIQFLVEEGAGIRDASIEPTSKKMYERRVEEASSYGLAVMQVDDDYVDFVVREALHQDKAKRDSLPARIAQAVKAWDGVVSGRPPKYSKHPVYYELNEEEIGQDRGILARSDELLSIDELSNWPALVPNRDDYNERAYRVIHSVITVTPAARWEMVARILQDAAEETMGGLRRHVFARRMEDLAYFLRHEGREVDAKRAFAVALALRRGDSLLKIPFVEALMLRAAGINLSPAPEPGEAADKKKRQDIPLIINPFR